jgi:hypothetical protein
LKQQKEMIYIVYESQKNGRVIARKAFKDHKEARKCAKQMKKDFPIWDYIVCPCSVE